MGLGFFQKSYQAQTMRPVVIYNHEKIGKILRDIMEKKIKHIHNPGNSTPYNLE